MASSSYCDLIVRHYMSTWARACSERRHEQGPIHQLPASFRVLEFAKGNARDMWTYATVCMSQPSDEQKLELHLFSPIQTPAHIELLYAIAHYHRTGSNLSLGHTVNFGRPWLDGSLCTFGLISLPYLDGPSIENLNLPSGKDVVKCLWLVPITESELSYKKKHGLEALESIFEIKGIDYLDPMRKSLV